MSLTSGFFNSYNGDRVYDAEEFSSFLDGIIYDGVYSAVGNRFYVAAAGGMKVTVDSGRAWFDHTWTLNTSKYNLTVSAADTVYTRIDAVVLEVNKVDRKNYLKIVKGTASASPGRPAMTVTASKIQHALAYITVGQNVTSITQSNIRNVVDTSETPLVSALSLAGIPSGGTIGQVLAKKSTESGAVGWYSIDKLPHDEWYLADGLSNSNVIGAFKFVTKSSESAALSSENPNTNYSLSKSSTSITWSSGNGFYIPPFTSLHNSSIFNSNPSAVIAKYSGGPSSGGPAIITSCGTGRQMFIRTPYTYSSTTHGNTGSGCYFGSISYSADGSASQPVRAASSSSTSGVLGCNFTATSASMYLNGSALSISSISGITGGVGNSYFKKLIGMRDEVSGEDHWSSPETWSWKGYYLQFIVFYNTTLTSAQHQAICNQINSEA